MLKKIKHLYTPKEIFIISDDATSNPKEIEEKNVLSDIYHSINTILIHLKEIVFKFKNVEIKTKDIFNDLSDGLLGNCGKTLFYALNHKTQPIAQFKEAIDTNVIQNCLEYLKLIEQDINLQKYNELNCFFELLSSFKSLLEIVNTPLNFSNYAKTKKIRLDLEGSAQLFKELSPLVHYLKLSIIHIDPLLTTWPFACVRRMENEIITIFYKLFIRFGKNRV